MNNAQKAAIRSKKQRGSQEQRDAAMLVNAAPLMVSQFNLFPNQGLTVEQQIEPVLFTLCVWGEARGEDTIGIQNVASVIIHRAEANRAYFGHGIRGVVLKHNSNGVYQFSAMKPGETNYKQMHNPDKLSWLKVAAVTMSMYFNGETILPVECMYYTAISNTYFDDNLGVELYKTHGGHKFYIEI